ncbi:arrestin domain-containing protein 1a isoform X2 [Festucalex cinctus]
MFEWVTRACSDVNKGRGLEGVGSHRKELYRPGEAITGIVTIKVDQKLPCKAIRVNCNGFCGITNKVNDTTWTVEEQYFNNTVSVADKGTLKQGQHTFPFKFLIPDSAPTSFEGNYGRIVYRIRAFVDTPRFTKDYSAEKAFYLLDPLNLNTIPDIWGPCSSSVIQDFSYMLLKTGTVMLKAQIDKKGYTPGQIIQLSTAIHNKSEKNTSNISASLMQRVSYQTKKTTIDVRTIAELEGGRVKAGKIMEWKDQIIVPPLPQSSLVGCDLIKIEYCVRVSLKSPNVLLTLPLHIGNDSLDNTFHPSRNEAHRPSAHVEGKSSASASASTSVPPPLAPKPTPRPAPRSRLSYSNTPTAPPTECHQAVESGTPMNNSSTNRQSQLVSPTGFSYAPGLSFSTSHQNRSGAGPEEPPARGAVTSNENTSIPVLTPITLPPDYGNLSYPQENSWNPTSQDPHYSFPTEAPPSYDESCNT